jgi:hypothetical protein
MAENTSSPSKEMASVFVAWMQTLECSLDLSRKALLALDLEGIQRGTTEQEELIRELDRIFERITTSSLQRLRLGPRSDAAPAQELEGKLREGARKVFDRLRLQRALLARARNKLRVLGNTLAGSSVLYGPLLVRHRALAETRWREERGA